ncbi:VanZ family protein [Amycolatopsis anabasis]|uniref:VanZ family protein n=1 Tax=Amycolatopsis anabasis TaxID=1840409 RepID=UPI00131E7554|nr:VanZ family protein [Amycolatopsis anabasis]
MENLLRDFGAMIPIAAVMLPVALLGWLVLAGRSGRRRGAVLAGIDVSIALTAALALCLVTLPVPGKHGSRLHLLPGEDVLTAFGEYGSAWQFAGNLLLLGPLGALVPLRSPALRSLPRVVLASLTASTLIELTQYLIHAGRVTSTDDVLLNTLGAAAGATLTRGWWRGPIPAPVVPAPRTGVLISRPVVPAPVRTPCVPERRYPGMPRQMVLSRAIRR